MAIAICTKCGLADVGVNEEGVCVFCDGTFSRPKEAQPVAKMATKLKEVASRVIKPKTKATPTKSTKK